MSMFENLGETYQNAVDFVSNLSDAGWGLVAGIGVIATLIILGCAFVPSDPMASRLRSHMRRRDRLRTERLQRQPRTRLARRVPLGEIRKLLNRLKLLSGEEAKRGTDLLARAGWRTRDALPIFMAIRVVLPFAVGAAAFFLFTTHTQWGLMYRLLGTSMATIVGAYLPTLVVKHIISTRQGKIRNQLPDALDLMVICAEAGLGLDAALGRIVRELGGAAPELSDELGLTAVELNFLPDRRQALQNLAKRTELPSIRGVVNTLIQTERYGTPLAHSLRVLALEFRDERMLKAEEKAARLPATLTVPMILFILPTLFVVLMGPAIIQVMENFHK